MKLLINVLTLLGVSFTGNVFAGANAGGGGAGFMVWFFIGFISLFVVSQLIPSIILTISLIKGIFAKTEKDAHNIID